MHLKVSPPLTEFAQIATEALTKFKSDVNIFADEHRTRLQNLANELDAKSPEIENVFSSFAQTYAASLEKSTA